MNTKARKSLVSLSNNRRERVNQISPWGKNSVLTDDVDMVSSPETEERKVGRGKKKKSQERKGRQKSSKDSKRTTSQ